MKIELHRMRNVGTPVILTVRTTLEELQEINQQLNEFVLKGTAFESFSTELYYALQREIAKDTGDNRRKNEQR